MKNLFSWRLHPSESDFINLWKSAIFVFDTNFLLDLYRVSNSTAKDFFSILEHLEARIWLPYQVASEFLNRREEIINSELASFQKALIALEKWKDEQLNFYRLRGLISEAGRIVNSEVEFLFDQQEVYKAAIEKVEQCFKDKIEELAETHSLLNLEEDYILEKLLTLFDGKVGEPNNTDNLQKLYREGEERYKQEKPPGFMDAKEKEDEQKYGDFILWRQILDFAKARSCSIVLVTGEKKEDWWTKKGHAIVSPHFGLRREFQEQVNQLFWMYQTQRFIGIAKEKLEIEISPRSIEEANVVAEANVAEEQSHEEISQLIRQIQNSTIREDLLKSIRTPTISEDLLKLLRTSTISEDLLKSLRTPIISEDLLKAFRTPTISEDLLKSLRIPTIREDLLKAFRTSTVSEDLLKSLRTPTISGDVLKAVKQMQKPAIDGNRSIFQSEENSVVLDRNMEVGLPSETLKKPVFEQNDSRESASAVDSNSTENKPEVKSQDVKSRTKRRSSSKKSKGNNLEK